MVYPPQKKMAFSVACHLRYLGKTKSPTRLEGGEAGDVVPSLVQQVLVLKKSGRSSAIAASQQRPSEQRRSKCGVLIQVCCPQVSSPPTANSQRHKNLKDLQSYL